MSIPLEWPAILLRLALAILAGGVLGYNRAERGVAAGLRTTLLVSLAAAVSMIQANLLLTTNGRPDNTFASMDVLRLPLGVLTGMGFIGGGAILRRGDRVSGVTTAATLWLTTTVGLAFGGGQLFLGLITLAIGVAALWFLKRPELTMFQERRAVLNLKLDCNGPTDQDIRGALRTEGYEIRSWAAGYSRHANAVARTIRCELQWRGQPLATDVPESVKSLIEQNGVWFIHWKS